MRTGYRTFFRTASVNVASSLLLLALACLSACAPHFPAPHLFPSPLDATAALLCRMVAAAALSLSSGGFISRDALLVTRIQSIFWLSLTLALALHAASLRQAGEGHALAWAGACTVTCAWSTYITMHAWVNSAWQGRRATGARTRLGPLPHMAYSLPPPPSPHAQTSSRRTPLAAAPRRSPMPWRQTPGGAPPGAACPRSAPSARTSRLPTQETAVHFSMSIPPYTKKERPLSFKCRHG